MPARMSLEKPENAEFGGNELTGFPSFPHPFPRLVCIPCSMPDLKQDANQGMNQESNEDADQGTNQDEPDQRLTFPGD